MSYGYMDYGVNPDRTPTKSEVKNALVCYLSSLGKPVNDVVVISDTPECCKHACSGAYLGSIFTSSMETFTYLGLSIPYYYFSCCGSLRVWLDF